MVITAIGRFICFASEVYRTFFVPSLYFALTIGPAGTILSITGATDSRSPPGLFLTSKTSPFAPWEISWSTCEENCEEVFLSNSIILTYPRLPISFDET
ncbi:MAG TPA: hypothetical protein VHO66_04840, partial [Ruminiclostridium sp.]|nr:hypothetical protein [Ruminiclostridium sp.]